MNRRNILGLGGTLAGAMTLPAAARGSTHDATITLPLWSAPGQTPAGNSTLLLSTVGLVDSVPQEDGKILYCANTTFGARWFAEADGRKLLEAWTVWMAKDVPHA